jgi:hypothetical protein
VVVRGGNGTDGPPMLATFGDNSPGIVLGGDRSTATLQIRDAYETAYGPAFQTSGDGATLIDIGMGGASSTSFIASSSSFGTYGDGSGVISLLAVNKSDQLVLLQNTTLSSTGNNATLLETAIGESSVRSIVAIGVDLSAKGDGSGGMIHRVVDGGGSSADTFFFANGTITTAGDDARAFLVEDHGGSSVRTAVAEHFAFSTLGSNSAALSVGGLGDGSAMDVTLTGYELDRSTLSTEGDDSAGLFAGGLGGGSAWSAAIEDS